MAINAGRTGVGISDLRGEIRVDYTDLMFGYKDPMTWFIRDKIFVQHPLPYTFGQFRRDLEETWFKVPDTTVPPTGIPNTISFGDESVNVAMRWLAQKVEYDRVDLRQFMLKGYMSEQDMIQGGIRKMGRGLKISEEIAAAVVVANTANYNAAQVKTMAASGDPVDVYWDDYNNSDPIATIMEMREENRYINTMAFNYPTLLVLQQHPKILGSSVVSAQDRRSADPWVYVETLKRVFGVENIHVGMAQGLTNSSKPSATVKEDVWGNNVWLGYVNPTAGRDPETPTWAKEYFYSVAGVEEYGGFFVTEYEDREVGPFGTLYERAWKCKQDYVYAKNMGSLIVNPLTP